MAFCEKEKYAQQILKQRFGAVLAQPERERLEKSGTQHPNLSLRSSEAGTSSEPKESKGNGPRLHDDIFTLNGADYAGVDLLTGGFPCQPFSVAGKRRGAEDDRAIWPEMLRVIREAEPAWIIGENVAGIVTMELDNILSDLEALGYAAWPLVVPACAVDARHRRDRVWIVAHAASKQNNRERRDSERGRDAVGRHEQAARRRNGQADNDGTGGQGEDVAHAIGLRELQPSGSFADERGRAGNQGEDVAEADEPSGKGNERTERSQQKRAEHKQHRGRFPQSPIRRMADGIPEGLDSGGGFCQWPEEDHETPRVTTGMKHRAHRLKGLGNAIVVQVATEIIRAISLTMATATEGTGE